MSFSDLIIAGDWQSVKEMTNANPEDNEETARKRLKLVIFFDNFKTLF